MFSFLSIRLYSIDSGYKAFCRADVDDDGEESTRKKKTNNKVAGAPTDDDWENARYFNLKFISHKLCIVIS